MFLTPPITLDSTVPSVLSDGSFVAGISAEVQQINRLIVEIAPTDIPVLIMGESGTGKEIVALQIHGLSRHRDLPFCKLHCAALSPETLQAQFSAPVRDLTGPRGGVAGTLFFDEISELDTNCQGQLLHCFPSEGGLGTPQQGARIISCTARDLEADVRAGRFRSELFYRLDGVCLRLPPLRQRKEDILLLAQFFLSKHAKLFGRAPLTLSDRVLAALLEHSWPGNIRELENVAKKIAALGNEEMVISDLLLRGAETRAPEGPRAPCSLKAAARAASLQAERELILQTLERTHWNRKRAAEVLQVSYKALLYKLKQIQGPDSERTREMGERP
jgi:two-component system response regulator AtoC